MSKIGDLIRQIARADDQELDTKICTVTAVDESERSVDVQLLNGDDIFLGVRLQSKISSTTGFVMFPTVGSNVIIELLNKDDAYVTVMTEVDKVKMGVGSSTIEIIDGEILFNSGNNGGLINISDLVVKLNNIENDLNTIKTVFSTPAWTPVPGDGGAALKTAAATWATTTFTPTVNADIEDDTVKH